MFLTIDSTSWEILCSLVSVAILRSRSQRKSTRAIKALIACAKNTVTTPIKQVHPIRFQIKMTENIKPRGCVIRDENSQNLEIDISLEKLYGR